MTRKNKILALYLVLIVVLLSSCSAYDVVNVGYAFNRSMKYENVDFPAEYREKFSSCRGFDFDRSFPGRKNRPSDVMYNYGFERVYQKDGLEFMLGIPGEGIRTVKFLDMKLTAKEKKYIAAYQKRKEEFDLKYAGEIKKKLRVVEKASQVLRDGKVRRSYPYYLEGDKLPDGLVTPSSIFSPYFFSDYINAEGKSNDLRPFILSTKWYKDFLMMDLARSIGRDAAGQVKSRVRPLYPEYVLTYYLLKEYASLEDRRQTAMALADYYSDIAFRSGAEALYAHKHLLSSGQRCEVANYIAARVYDLVMVIDNPQRLERIKKEYKEEIVGICKSNLASSRTGGLYGAGIITKKEWVELDEITFRAVDAGKLRCIND